MHNNPPAGKVGDKDAQSARRPINPSGEGSSGGGDGSFKSRAEVGSGTPLSREKSARRTHSRRKRANHELALENTVTGALAKHELALENSVTGFSYVLIADNLWKLGDGFLLLDEAVEIEPLNTLRPCDDDDLCTGAAFHNLTVHFKDAGAGGSCGSIDNGHGRENVGTDEETCGNGGEEIEQYKDTEAVGETCLQPSNDDYLSTGATFHNLTASFKDAGAGAICGLIDNGHGRENIGTDNETCRNGGEEIEQCKGTRAVEGTCLQPSNDDYLCTGASFNNLTASFKDTGAGTSCGSIDNGHGGENVGTDTFKLAEETCHNGVEEIEQCKGTEAVAANGSDGIQQREMETGEHGTAIRKLSIRFHDFHDSYSYKTFEEGQIWALFDEIDGFPRSYALIDKLIPSESKVDMRLLEPHPTSDREIQWMENDIPMACGTFRASNVTTIRELTSLSHRLLTYQEWETVRSYYRIFPRKGEVWAIYTNWSPGWSYSDWRNNLLYTLVEVVTDSVESAGIIVAALTRVAGQEAVYRRRLLQGFGLFMTIPKNEMLRFSHQIPSLKLTGDKKNNRSKGLIKIKFSHQGI